MGIAAPFKNLKNPVLRKTVGKLATIEKVARIGNLEVLELLNMLRKEVGQAQLHLGVDSEVVWQEGEPQWIRNEPQNIIDGSELLNRGEHPLQKVHQLMRESEKGDILLLKTNFKPIPLIEEMQKHNYEVYHKTAADQADQHFTFIRK
jgi:hypothetical protein